MTEEGFNIGTHILVPEHRKLSAEEKQKILEELESSINQLPKIKSKDPAIKAMEAESGDVIEIIRDSPTTGTTKYYRVVISG
jgi:DNA-directed RNA polymerase subunit H